MSPKSYKKLLPILSLISKNHVIDLANPDKFPEFYEEENSFDVGHLNGMGAELMTQALVSQIKARQIKID
jgi:hypothetical protein